jgi:hypothetical protein
MAHQNLPYCSECSKTITGNVKQKSDAAQVRFKNINILILMLEEE